MLKWRELVVKKAKVERQRAEILAAFKNQKVEEAFGQLSGEKFFKPITSRLTKEKRKEAEGPDYTMDEFDYENPFINTDFKPDEYSPLAEEPDDLFEDTDQYFIPEYLTQEAISTPLPRDDWHVSAYSEASTLREWEDQNLRDQDSTDLSTLGSLITKYGKIKGYRVQEPRSKFSGLDIEGLKKERDKILERRERWQTGTGFNDLATKIGSIKAGNTSLKLRMQIGKLLKKMVRQRVLTEAEGKKIFLAIV